MAFLILSSCKPMFQTENSKGSVHWPASAVSLAVSATLGSSVVYR